MADIGPDAGLEIARRFWEASRDELFAGELAELAPRAAAGLVGEGSECFGYDDELSRDHDWGPGFCVWLGDEDFAMWGEQLQARYDALASRGFEGMLAHPETRPRRVGVFSVDGFYRQHLRAVLPHDIDSWKAIDESALAAATNGEVFFDGSGEFTMTRERLLGYYPEDLRLRKIARGCMVAAQAGQYNLARQARRADELGTLASLTRFADAVQEIAFALARRYRPFYKWSGRMLGELGLFGREAKMALEGLAAMYKANDIAQATRLVDALCAHTSLTLLGEGLIDEHSPWLVNCAEQVNARISDAGYRATNLMQL